MDMKGIKMEKIKLLQFPIANSKGGITHYALQNWKWMDKNKFSCDFVTMSKHLDFEEEILASGSKIFYISCYAEEDKEQFSKEFEEILARGYDIVHLHTKQWKSILVEEICKKYQVKKVIVHSHSIGIDTSDPLQREKEVILHEQVKQNINEDIATDFWACSESAARFLFGGHITQEKIKIMPNAIDIDKFAYSKEVRDDYRKKYGLINSFVIGHVGRFSYAKNHEFLIRVFHEILRREKKAKLILLGDGELMPQVREQVRTLHMEEQVLFLGKRDDVCCWYQAMDVGCLPSRYEGLGIAMIEAQAAGLPFIASTNVPKDVEIIKSSLRIPLDVDEWVEQILACKKKTRINALEQLSEAGYSLENQIHVIEEEYQKSIL